MGRVVTINEHRGSASISADCRMKKIIESTRRCMQAFHPNPPIHPV